MSGSASYRGHLFCDLRGYTAYVEHHGNAAAVELLTEFRSIVRQAVEAYDGSEIKTEGDSFYVVFPSASAAVMCGLDIVRAAAESTRANPDRPLRVGVGVQAGEAAEIDGTFVGSAVNVAARVCARARPGEVLVTATVRSLTQGTLDAGFVSRGRLRLKGIREPVAVFAALPPGADMPRGGVDRRVVIGAVVAGLGLILLALAAISLLQQGSPGPSDGRPSLDGPVAEIGPLSVGRHATDDFRPGFAFNVADQGWTLADQGATAVEMLYDSQDLDGRLTVIRIPSIYDNPCLTDGTTTPVGETPDSLIASLRSVEFIVVDGSPKPAAIDGHSGLTVDFHVSSSVFASCDSAGEVPLFPIPQGAWRAQPDNRIRLTVVPIGGRLVTTLITSANGVDAPVVQLDAFFASAQSIVDSIDFAE